jgi:DnaJ-class molecular chaperone
LAEPDAIKDPYQILGVARTASQDEIKNAYRDLAKRHHPDLNPGRKDAERMFKDISAAYELVGTPEKRARFDRGEAAAAAAAAAARRGGPWYHPTQAGGGEARYSSSFGAEGFDEELLRSIFGGGAGGGRRAAGPRAGRDQLYRMDLELRDAALGGEREITLPGGRRLAVKIPAGVTDGMRLRFAGQGDPGAGGGPAGDAYVELHVRPDPRFRRSGDDIELELPISLPEAVLGGEARVPTLEGEVALRIPRHSNTGRRLRLAGKGVFSRATGRRGDQLVILKVVLPERVDPELEELVGKWAAGHPYDPRAPRQGEAA